MKTNFLRMASNMILGLTKTALIVALAVATPMLTACTKDNTDNKETPKPKPTPTPEAGFTYTGGDQTCTAAESTISFSFSTTAGFVLDTDKTNIVEFLTPEQSSSGGTFNSTVKVKKNESREERKANIYITVSGGERELLLTITQDGATMDEIEDEVLAYVDERLQKEYYWLEEYNEKRSTFDPTLAADEYLDESLLSLTTNIADGGYDYRGNRYIYSYIYALDAASAQAGTRASSVSGYGIMMSGNYWSLNNQGTEFGIVIEHVYPDSPAEKAGLNRGNIIAKYNGKAITANNLNEAWADLHYSLSSNITVSIFDLAEQKITETKTISTGSYKENPVAASMVLELEDGPKVGYLSYLGFESAFDSELIDAMRSLKDNGAEEMVLDLRLNGGGSVNSSTILGSMLLDASYNDQTYAILARNAANKKANTTCKITSAYNGQSLPRLGIKRLYVITTDNTASASEMVISGLRGLDVEVILIGTTTEGKNCGMDVTQITRKGVTYEYAPITFMNFNAKSYEQYLAGQPYFDYPDGIEADCDMEYYAVNAKDDTVKALANYYPMPLEPWGEASMDVALIEALMQIQGKSLLTFTSANAHKEINLQPAHKLANMTRAGEIGLPTLERKFKGGATLTEEERIAFDSQAYK
jgi:C-terminal processing protease CtpA/Prc